MNNHYYIRFGQAYGEGSYSECVYNNTQDCDTNGGGNTGTGSTGGGANTDTGSGGQLTDTGFTILVIATLACLILFTAIIARVWRRPARQQVSERQQDPRNIRE